MGFLDWELKVLDHPCRFPVICGARRIRKTDLLIKWLLLRLSQLPSGSEAWYLAPTYRQAKMVAWRRSLEYIPNHLIERKSEVELEVEIKGGHLLAFKGCDNRESLRGGSPWLAGFDEYAYCDPWAWEEVVQPALSDKTGPAMFISTPRGRNHFYNMYRMGKEEQQGWKSWAVTQEEVRTIPLEELARLKRVMPLDMFRQEYECVFLGHTGLIIPEFIPKLWPDGNILPMSMWKRHAEHGVFWGSGDYGRGEKTMFHWYAGNDQLRTVMFWEYAGYGTVLPRQVGMDLNALDQQLMGKKIYRALDKTCWHRQETSGTSIAALLQKEHVHVIEAEGDFDASVLQVRSLCKSEIDEQGNDQMPRFMVLEGTCHTGQYELSTLEDQQNETGERRVRRGTPHNAFDSIRYGVMFRRRAPSMALTKQEDTRPRLPPEEMRDQSGVEIDEVSGIPV